MTPADILQNLFSLIAVLIAIFGLFKSTAERKKVQAETLQIYSEMLDQASNREKDLKNQIQEFENQINTLGESVQALQKIVKEKDGRIEELEVLSKKQESEILALRTELDSLKKKQK